MQRQAAKSGTAGTDPYDNGLFMPLRQFIEEPIVKDLLHNGAALQVGTMLLERHTSSILQGTLMKKLQTCTGPHHLKMPAKTIAMIAHTAGV